MPYEDKEKEREAKRRYDKKRKGRTRNFATVVYPESAPSDWQERLSELHIEALISPLHDCDVNPDGEPKKPHWHVLVMFQVVKDFDTQVKPIFDAIGGVGRENVGSVRGYARYLCHLDNPEKHQYSPSDVVQMGGADYSSIIHLPSGDTKVLMDIFRFVRENWIMSYADLLDILVEVNTDWFNLIVESKSYVVVQYMKALSWESESDYTPHVEATDEETGEKKILVVDHDTGELRELIYNG